MLQAEPGPVGQVGVRHLPVESALEEGLHLGSPRLWGLSAVCLAPQGLGLRSHDAQGHPQVTDIQKQKHHSRATVSLRPAHGDAGTVDAGPRPPLPGHGPASLPRPGLHRTRAPGGSPPAPPSCSAPMETCPLAQASSSTHTCPQRCQGDRGPVQSHPPNFFQQGRGRAGQGPPLALQKAPTHPSGAQMANEVGRVLGIWKGPGARCRPSPFL